MIRRPQNLHRGSGQPDVDITAEALHAREEATCHSLGVLYLSSHIFRAFNAPPQQIACPPDGHAMPGTYGAVNRHGNKLNVNFG